MFAMEQKYERLVMARSGSMWEFQRPAALADEPPLLTLAAPEKVILHELMRHEYSGANAEKLSQFSRQCGADFALPSQDRRQVALWYNGGEVFLFQPTRFH